MSVLNNYLEITVVGIGLLTKFYTSASSPHVGDLVNFSNISTLAGYHKVLEVRHKYTTQEREGPECFATVEILIEKEESQGINWLTGME